jgi:predicted DNA-binding transcriptional regulator AlpA
MPDLTNGGVQKELISVKEFAALASMSDQWISKQERLARGFPARVQCGRSVRYRLSDVRAFLSRLTVSA